MFQRRIGILSPCLLGIVALTLVVPNAWAQYALTDIDVPGSTETDCNAINTAGTVVGSYVDRNGLNHGFTLTRGEFARIDAPNAQGGTLAYGINDQSQIVGWFTDAHGVTHGFSLKAGAYAKLDPPNSVLTNASGINNAGTIVGTYLDSLGVYHGFVDDAGIFTTVDVPGSTLTQLTSINNRGQMVGIFLDPSGTQHGFQLINGKFRKIDYPGSRFTAAYGINDKGEVVGLYGAAANGPFSGYARSQQTYTTVLFPGATETRVRGVNNAGRIVGRYTDAGGGIHGYIGGSPYPLKASANHRYLVDQNGVPVLLVGDSPHSMFVNLSSTDLATYLANRQNHGFNILWVEALCSDYISNCRIDLSTYDGIKPFTSGTNEFDYDVSNPNPAYWSRVDSYVNTATNYGMTILFDTWETGALMPLAEVNGKTKMHNFGVFLGNRYKNVPNIVWITGNDFQTWTDNTDNTLMQNLMAGIASADKSHLQTTELNFYASGSMDDTLLVPYTTLAGAYDQYCSYGETLAQYNYATPVPVFFEEGFYEFDQGDVGLRIQSWWVALAGATAGQMYGNLFIYPFAPGWQDYLDTIGVTQYGYLTSMLKSIQWYNLVPDQSHKIVTAGYGTLDAGETDGCLYSNDYVTTSYLPDGTASVSYAPKSTTLTVNLGRFRGPVTAQWYDPTTAIYYPIAGSPFRNSGSQAFATPNNNAEGYPDWVLKLTAQ